MKYLLVLLIFCSCRVERICDFKIDNICFNQGEYEIDHPILAFALEIAREELSEQYNIGFGYGDLAKEQDLYVTFKSLWEVKDICNNLKIAGCYIPFLEEIYIGSDNSSSEYLIYYDHPFTLAHEMLHFYAENILFHQRPGLFDGEDKNEIETSHLTPYLWEDWAKKNDLSPIETVEGKIRNSIHLKYIERRIKWENNYTQDK